LHNTILIPQEYQQLPAKMTAATAVVAAGRFLPWAGTVQSLNESTIN